MTAPRSFFITGASSGFGREITRLLLASGRRVAATSRSAGKLAELSESFGGFGGIDPGMSVYNASKFGIEGFYESAAIELAPLGIRMTLIEPGGSRTDFNTHIVTADPLPAYDAGVLGQIGGMLGGGAAPEQLRKIIAGDPAKIAQAVVDIAADDDPPLRITLGDSAYRSITDALCARLDALHAQKELALSTDADDAR